MANNLFIRNRILYKKWPMQCVHKTTWWRYIWLFKKNLEKKKNYFLRKSFKKKTHLQPLNKRSRENLVHSDVRNGSTGFSIFTPETKKKEQFREFFDLSREWVGLVKNREGWFLLKIKFSTKNASCNVSIRPLGNEIFDFLRKFLKKKSFREKWQMTFFIRNWILSKKWLEQCVHKTNW